MKEFFSQNHHAGSRSQEGKWRKKHIDLANHLSKSIASVKVKSVNEEKHACIKKTVGHQA